MNIAALLFFDSMYKTWRMNCSAVKAVAPAKGVPVLTANKGADVMRSPTTTYVTIEKDRMRKDRMKISRSSVKILALTAGALLLFGMSSSAQADTIEMTLHGFCGASAGTSTCSDNGTITPTSSNPLLLFGFTRSPDTNSGLTAPISFDLVALVPDNAPGAGSQTLTYTGTGTSVSTPLTLALQAGGASFTTGTLDAFLGFTSVGGPANPFGGFQAGESNQGFTVTGFKVYLANFGSVTFGSPDPTFVPSGGFSGNLIQGTELYALIDGPGAGQRQDATALSSTLIETGTPRVPEPTTLLLVGTGLLVVGAGVWSRRQR